jgi:hypothetical protein
MVTKAVSIVITRNTGSQIKNWYKKKIMRFIPSYFLQKYYKLLNKAKRFTAKT